MTERIYSTQAYEKSMTATVVDVDREDGRVLLDRSVFYPGGGGQPFDEGALVIGDDRLKSCGSHRIRRACGTGSRERFPRSVPR